VLSFLVRSLTINNMRQRERERRVTARLMVFLDDGGVMNDNGTRALQWQHLVSEFFVPLLGGSAGAWSHANRVVADCLFEPDAWRRRVQAAADYRSFDRAYQVEWLRGMCALGLCCKKEADLLKLAKRAKGGFMTEQHPFKWRHFQADIILLCVRWYLRYSLRYRDLEEIMLERGLAVDHTTIYRWVQRYAPELEKRCRPHLKACNDSWRVDETYIKVKKVWVYLYRAVDSEGNTLEFLLSPTRDAQAAKRFFVKALHSPAGSAPQAFPIQEQVAHPTIAAAPIPPHRLLV
jgi:hypothetical protein